MARSCCTLDLRLELEAELRGKGDDFLFQVQQQLQRDVKEVAAAAGGVQHDDGGSFLRNAARRGAVGAACPCLRLKAGSKFAL